MQVFPFILLNLLELDSFYAFSSAHGKAFRKSWRFKLHGSNVQAHTESFYDFYWHSMWLLLWRRHEYKNTRVASGRWRLFKGHNEISLRDSATFAHILAERNMRFSWGRVSIVISKERLKNVSVSNYESWIRTTMVSDTLPKDTIWNRRTRNITRPCLYCNYLQIGVKEGLAYPRASPT